MTSLRTSTRRLLSAIPDVTIASLIITQVADLHAIALRLLNLLISPSMQPSTPCPAVAVEPADQRRRRPQNGNRNRSRKSEHDSRRVISRATTPSADVGVEDERCARKACRQKTPAPPDPPLYATTASTAVLRPGCNVRKKAKTQNGNLVSISGEPFGTTCRGLRSMANANA